MSIERYAVSRLVHVVVRRDVGRQENVSTNESRHVRAPRPVQLDGEMVGEVATAELHHIDVHALRVSDLLVFTLHAPVLDADRRRARVEELVHVLPHAVVQAHSPEIEQGNLRPNARLVKNLDLDRHHQHLLLHLRRASDFDSHVRRVIASAKACEADSDDGLRGVRRNLPQLVVALLATRRHARQLQLKVTAAAVDLRNLQGKVVRIVELNLGRNCGVQREFDADQRPKLVLTLDTNAANLVIDDPEGRVDDERRVCLAELARQEHHLEGCVRLGLYHFVLEVRTVEVRGASRYASEVHLLVFVFIEQHHHLIVWIADGSASAREESEIRNEFNCDAMTKAILRTSSNGYHINVTEYVFLRYFFVVE